MESLFSNLSKILTKQNQTLAALLAAAWEHNTALRKNDTKAILATSFQQEKLSRELIVQDGEREEIQRKLAGEYRSDKQPVLSALLSYAPATAAEDLKELSRSFKATLTQLSEIKDLNNILARRGQIITEQLLKVIGPINGNTYCESGKMEDRAQPQPFVDKTI